MTFTLGKFKSTDVFTMATLLSKIGISKAADAFERDTVMKIFAESKGKKGKDGDEVVAATGMQIALKVADVVLGNIEKCETEIFKLLSNVSGMEVDEIKDLDAEIFAELIVAVVQMPQFKDFFKAASRLLNTGN